MFDATAWRRVSPSIEDSLGKDRREVCASVPLVVLAATLAYSGALWLNLFHELTGGHEHHEPPLAVHALRDGTLALPVVLVAVTVAVLLSGRLLRATPSASARLRRAVTSVFAAGATALALAAGNPVQTSRCWRTRGGRAPTASAHGTRRPDRPCGVLARGGSRSAPPGDVPSWCPGRRRPGHRCGTPDATVPPSRRRTDRRRLRNRRRPRALRPAYGDRGGAGRCGGRDRRLRRLGPRRSTTAWTRSASTCP